MIPRVLLSLGAVLALAGPLCAAGGWRYVVPDPKDPFANPPPRALALSDTRPADLKESARYRGSKRRYAQLVYGTGRTAAVAVVVDEVAPGKLHLYVDSNRDREITDRERVAGEGLEWRVPLRAVVPDGSSVKEYPRTVLFRYGRVSRTLAVATCGYVEGRVRLGGKVVAARRVDGDANGFFADAQDRLWVDRDGDGEWDAFSEEFLFAPILRLGEQRYAVRADSVGERLSLAPLEGTGKLRLKLPATLKPQQVEEVLVTVQSRDGVVASLRDLAGEVTVPVGDYRISSLLLTLKDPRGGPSWGYVFGDNGGKGYRWHRLGKGRTLMLDPVGTPEFTASVGDGKGECRAGESLTVRPALYTGDGLLIEKAYRGAFTGGPSDSGCAGRIVLADAGGRALDSATSGFA